jgi:hypothetical protein
MKVKAQELRGSKWSRGGPWTLAMEAWRLRILSWRVCRPVVADSINFDKEQDPDPQ